MHLHPESLTIDGKQYVVLPRDEYTRLREAMVEIEYIVAQEKAKALGQGQSRIPWEQIKREFGFN